MHGVSQDFVPETQNLALDPKPLTVSSQPTLGRKTLVAGFVGSITQLSVGFESVTPSPMRCIAQLIAYLLSPLRSLRLHADPQL